MYKSLNIMALDFVKPHYNRRGVRLFQGKPWNERKGSSVVEAQLPHPVISHESWSALQPSVHKSRNNLQASPGWERIAVFGCSRSVLDLALGCILHKRLVEATREAVKHHKAFLAFNMALDSAEPGITKKWGKEEEDWQEDRSQLCPYCVTKTGKTMKDMELELAREEFEETASNVQVVHKSSSSMCTLELEVKAKKVYQELDFQKHCNAIKKKIEHFR
ncbi:hypothetical protein B0H14DRAFT_2597931 [Mycena olivaceomarginata]|nr:hypothetical protein B0H14DRAFT_2597931 [Mycena olivaceomarginata]